MTENNDINSTNGAPKEYWEARARNEREQAENRAYIRNMHKKGLKAGKIAVLCWLGAVILIILFIFGSILFR
jgi:hypothetical protein